MYVQDIAAVAGQEAGHRLINQALAIGAQHLRQGAIDLLDFAERVYRDVAHWQSVVELLVAAFARRKTSNSLLQFIVLHFELGLMNSKFVDESYGVIGKRP
jgi:hypothetical protein